MIGRVIWWIVLLAAAFVTTALQIDKQSEETPALAPAVPAPLRNFAQTHITAAAVNGKDPARGLAEARRLVRQRPVPAEYLTLLAVAQTRAGQGEAAAVTIQIAAKRGWRQPTAQEVVLRLALAAGDKPEAARRYTALFLRDSTPNALLEEFGPAVLGEPGGPGQQTMVEILLGTERWQSTFIRRGAQVLPPKALAAIALASREQGAQFDCGVLKQAVRVVQRRDPEAAPLLEQAGMDCPKGKR